MKWRSDKKVRPDKTVHVWPQEEAREHVLHGTSCECIVRLKKQNGVTIVTHGLLSLKFRKVGQ